MHYVYLSARKKDNNADLLRWWDKIPQQTYKLIHFIVLFVWVSLIHETILFTMRAVFIVDTEKKVY